MGMKKITNIGAIIGLVVVGASVYTYVYGVPFMDRLATVAEIGETVPPGTINLSDKDLPQNVGDSVQKDGYTITKELVPAGEQVTQASVNLSKIPAPDYKKIPKKPANMAVESYNAIVAKMQAIVSDIQKQIDANKKDGTAVVYTDGWLDIALYKNMLGDTAGAEAVWVYLTQVSPGLFQPYGNLANLYLTRQNFSEAETWYLRAIEKKPDYLQYYSDLGDIYSAQKRTADFGAILEKGMRADPKAWNMQVALGRYYASVDDSKNARLQFNAAIELAKKAGNSAASAAIEQEVLSLGK
jgi:tetratricopeptide (TPR) repeat protein